MQVVDPTRPIQSSMTEKDDRLAVAARSFVRHAEERARSEAAFAVECLRCGSEHGVRRHLTSLRQLAERQARIQRYILHRSARAAELRRAADAALLALDGKSPKRIVRALARVEALTR